MISYMSCFGSRRELKYVLILFVLFLSGPCLKSQLYINEFVASSSSNGYYDNLFHTHPDWIEIYNSSGESIDLSGYYITDDLNDIDKWKIPSGTSIKGYGYLLFIADGMDVKNHTNFKLSSDGESIGLSNPSKVLIDSLIYMPQRSNMSMGREANNFSNLIYYTSPSPGKANNLTHYNGQALSPKFSINGGFYDTSIQIELSHPSDNAIIRYTINGQNPSMRSKLYTGPIAIKSNTVVKAIVFETGKLNSAIVTNSYFINEESHLPVVSFSLDPNLVRSFPGNREREVSFEYFNHDLEKVISQNIGVRRTGLVNIYPLRTTSLYARSEYGDNRINYRLFKDKDLTEFKNVVLRNAGYKDYSSTYFRDGLMQSFVSNSMDIEYQAYQPVVVFLNGAYHGLMNMREKENEFYIAYNGNVNKDSIDFLEYQTNAPIEVIKGDRVHFDAMTNFVKSADMKQDENVEYIETLLDLDNFLDYYMLQIYVSNGDWPDKNCKIWRPKTATGRWRWMIFDTDFGYGYKFPVDKDMFTYLNDVDAPYYHNRPWATLFFRKLMNNEKVRNYFLQRFCALLNTNFSAARAFQLVNELKEQIEPEMERHLKKWGSLKNGIGNLSSWEKNCEVLNDYAMKRPSYVRTNMMNFYELKDTVNIKFTSVNGSVYLNNIKYCAGNMSGCFFKDVPIQLKAIPNDGYKFVKWKGTVSSTNDSISFMPGSKNKVKAVFAPVYRNILHGTITKNKTLSNSSDPYVVTGDLIIPEDVHLTLKEGVRLLMPTDCNIYVYGTLTVDGTADNQVVIDAYGKTWGGVCFHHSTGISKLTNLQLLNATTGGDPELYIGAISSYKSDVNLNAIQITDVPSNPIFAQYGNVVVSNCTLKSKGTCDLINIKNADYALVENCKISDSTMKDTDAIDFDNIESGIIRNNTIYNLVGDNSDGIDIGEGCMNVLIYGNVITNCFDKGISVGQSSSATIQRNVIYSCTKGIGIKDYGSFAEITNNTILNTSIGVSCFEKNLGKGAGNAKVENTIIANSELAPYFMSNGGLVDISYSISNDIIMPGAGNVFDDPRIVSPICANFALGAHSPCVNAGDPSAVLDRDDSVVDIGAYYMSPSNTVNDKIIVNEYYSKSCDDDPEDWVEIYNKGEVSVDISGWYLQDGGRKYFQIPQNTSIKPDSYLLLCKDTADFKSFFTSTKCVVGNFDFSLGNARDEIKLFDDDHNSINAFSYDEDKHWPDSKDKTRFSVALINSSLRNNIASNWRVAYKKYGTPGYSNMP